MVLIRNTVTPVCIYFPHAFATSILETACICLLNTTTPHKNHHQCCHHTQNEYFTTASYNTWVNGKVVTLIILKKKRNFYLLLEVAKANLHHDIFPQNSFYPLWKGSC